MGIESLEVSRVGTSDVTAQTSDAFSYLPKSESILSLASTVSSDPEEFVFIPLPKCFDMQSVSSLIRWTLNG
jgi:hypothetical protein